SSSGTTTGEARHSAGGVNPTSRHQPSRLRITAAKSAGTTTSAKGRRYCHQLAGLMATTPRIAVSAPTWIVQIARAKRRGPRRGGLRSASPAAVTSTPMATLSGQSRPGRKYTRALANLDVTRLELES